MEVFVLKKLKATVIVGGALYNMGSQALLRGTAQVIHDVAPECEITVSSAEENFNSKTSIPFVKKYIRRYSFYGRKPTPLKVICSLCDRIFHDRKLHQKIKHYKLLKMCKKADIVVVIGGDNYDKTYNSLEYMQTFNQLLLEFGKSKALLFNCSVSEEDLFPEAIEDMSAFSYITARDGISFGNMKNALKDKTKVLYYPDIAFVMHPQKIDLPMGWEPGNMIGINASSLITDELYSANPNHVIEQYSKMIDYIIKNTSLKICLLPHVKNEKDLSVLRVLYDGVSDENRVILFEADDFNTAQIKYVISQFRMFVGARTHATIAAYSSCVPTLVVGYSIKSIGIATDIFGTADGFVVSTENLDDEGILQKSFVSFFEREEEIRETLKNVMPEYINKAQNSGELFLEIIKSRKLAGKND